MVPVAFHRQTSPAASTPTPKFLSKVARALCFVLFAWWMSIVPKLTAQQFVNVSADFAITAQPHSINFGSGMSFCDFDNDGWDDLTFTMTNDSLRFYRNNGSGFDLMPSIAYGDGETKHALWVDYDNDGDLDLAVSINNGRYRLYRNNGAWSFTDVSEEAGWPDVEERHYGLSFADYDRDGDLDFYVCVYALDAGPDLYATYNHLYRNNGDGTFTDVTLEAGVEDGVRLSFQSIWFDYDQDGWVDLFVINDRLYANSLYRNNGDGTFTDHAVEAGVAFPGQDPMTASLGDFDNDGDFDIYLTNTGVTGKKPKLLVNNGDGTFSEQAEELGVTIDVWTWGAVWVDTENDGWQDLYVATDDPNLMVFPSESKFFKQSPDGVFSPSQASFIGNHIARSHSVARGDYNNDGFYDIAVLNKFPYQPFLWENQGGDNKFLKVTLSGTLSNSHAIGSLIEVYVGGLGQRQWTMCGENYLGQNSQHHIFGLGQNSLVDSLIVTYPSGHIDRYYNIEANQSLQLEEGETYTLSLHPTGQVDICEGEALLLSAPGYENYLWSDGSQADSLVITESGLYGLTVTNSFGISASDEVQVTVHPLPDLLVTGEGPDCFGSANGSASVINLHDVPASAVIWSNGMEGEWLDGLPAGFLELSFTDLFGCSQNAEINLLEPLELIAIAEVINASESQGGSVQITASGGTEPHSIFLEGTFLPQGMANLLTPGVYNYNVVDGNDCEVNGSFTVEMDVNVLEHMVSPIKLFPNPGHDRVFLSGFKSGQFVEIQVFDMQGRLVFSQELSFEEPLALDFHLPVGCYTVHAGTKNKQAAHRLEWLRNP